MCVYVCVCVCVGECSGCVNFGLGKGKSILTPGVTPANNWVCSRFFFEIWSYKAPTDAGGVRGGNIKVFPNKGEK